MEEMLYESEGYVQASVAAIILMIVGVGVAALVLIFVSVLGGQTYQLVESDIDAISCATVKSYIKSGIESSFNAMKQTGTYLPIVVLAVVITIILGLIVGLTGQFGGGMGGATAL